MLDRNAPVVGGWLFRLHRPLYRPISNFIFQRRLLIGLLKLDQRQNYYYYFFKRLVKYSKDP